MKLFILLIVAKQCFSQGHRIPPNILLLQLDQPETWVQEEDAFTETEDQLIMTMVPTLKRLSQNGIVFEQYGRSSNSTTSFPSRKRFYEALGHNPQLFRSINYKTVGIGKWHFNYQETTNLPIHHGFEEYYDILQEVGSNDLFFISVTAELAGVDVSLTIPETLKFDQKEKLLTTEIYTEMILTKLNYLNTEISPFFLQLSLNPDYFHERMPCHLSTTSSTDSYIELIIEHEKTLVRRWFSLVEKSVAALVNHLKSSGQWDNTVFLCLSENGQLSAPGFLGGGFVERSLLATNTAPYRLRAPVPIYQIYAALCSLAVDPEEAAGLEWFSTGTEQWQQLITGRLGPNKRRLSVNEVDKPHPIVQQTRALLSTSTEILSSLYSGAVGAAWLINTNWLIGDPCPSGNWYGVTCSASEVVNLQLPSNNLFGTVPSQMGLLTLMTRLNLKVNSLYGSLPSEFGQLTGMTSNFEINSNSFTGLLPSELGQMNAMTTFLYVYSNRFTGKLPSQLGQLSKMRSFLYFNSNSFTGLLPSELGRLTKMQSYLYAYSNSFSGSLPSQLGQLTGMTAKFYVNSNSFTGLLPSELGQLTGIGNYFYVYSNSFTGSLPSQLGRLSLMQNYFYINSNRFSGSLPSQLGQLTGMTTKFYLYSNSFTGSLPSELGQLTLMTSYLYLYSNSFTASLPSQLGRMTGMESYFYLLANMFTGSLPSQLGQLTSMTYNLNIRSNSFSGSLPSQLGQLTNLEGALQFYSNSFTGSLPSQLGQLTKMTTFFYVYSNRFTGALPSQLGRLSSLTNSMRFHINSFTGSLPSQLGQLTSLQSFFHINSNSFTGSVPSELGQLESLTTEFLISSNSFTGALPSQLGQLTKMTSLFYVAYNRFTFSLPSELGRLSSFISTIRIEANSFTGSLPSELGQLTKMTSSFHAYSNSFTGSLPSQLGQLSSLTTDFLISSNKFIGLLPSELGQLSSIGNYFNVDSNSFTGSLPSELGQLSSLTTEFRIQGNDFTGWLPSEIGQLTKMTSYFHIYSNSFTGSLPSELGQLSSLTTSFRIQANDFTGVLPSELGQLTSINNYFIVNSNSFTGSVPSQLGQLSSLTASFSAFSNKFCGELPSEVSLLSSQLTSGWDIGNNSLGTPCCESSSLIYTCAPTSVPTISPTLMPTSLPTYVPTVLCFAGTYYDGEQCFSCTAGRYSNFTSAPYPSSCSLCPTGQYNSQSAATECTECDSGKLSSADRTFCGDCNAGEYSFNDVSCVSCEFGKYAPQALSDSCLECGAGSHTNALTKATSCVTCDGGSFSNGSTFNCSFCAPGTFSASGASDCSDCSTGYASSEYGAPTCVACSAGTYTDTAGSSNCTSCASGQYQGSAAQSTCEDCDAGKVSSESGATSCVSCEAGRYSSVDGGTLCESCNAGKISSEGSASCTDCTAGFFTASNGSISCTACVAGKYSSNVSSTFCSLCPSGRYQGATGQPSCEYCDSGKVSSESGATSCTSCEAGRYAAIDGGTLCESCDAGKISSEGSASCTDCTAGFFTASNGSISCTACVAGKYSSNVSSTFCSLCAAGSYQGATSQSTCVSCASGTFSSTTGAVLCDNCALEYMSVTGSTSCTLAAVDYYLTYSEDGAVLSEKCPGHSVCYGTDYAPAPEKNYWVDRSSYDYVAYVYPCPRDTCKGTTSNSSCWRYAAYSDDNLCDTDTLLCTEGAFGPLCGSCGDGYVYRGESKTCSQCGDAKMFVFTLLGIGAGLIIVLAVMLLCFQYGYLSLKWFRLKSVDSGSLKVAWVTYQIIISVSWNLDIKFPPMFTQMLSMLSVLSLEILSLECFQTQSAEERYYFTVYLWSMLPILFAVLITLIGLLRYLAVFSDSTKKSKVVSQHVWLLLLWSYLVLPPVTMKQLQGLDCIPFRHDDSSYLRTDTVVNCRSSGYYTFKTVVILFFCLYQLIPVSWMFLLYQHRDALHIPFSQNEELSLNQRDANPALSHIRFLFKDYRGTKWWFEVAEMYRRVMFIGVLPLFTPSSSKRASLGCMFAILSYVYFREEEPFREKFTNNIACMAQITILLTFYTALSIDTGVVIDFGLGDFGIGLFLVGTNLLVCMLVIYLTLTRYQRIKQEESWRRPLTTQQLSVVRRVMNEDSAPPPGSLRKSQEQQDAATSEMMSQFLLRPSDVVMLKRVGAGAFGEVFKGTCMGEKVAVKTMIDVTESNVREFKAEIVLTATLRHPNIVNFVGACWGKELMCLVLEWVAKGSLRDLLETQDLRWVDPLLRLATDVARGMNYLHNRKYYDEREGETLKCILHRDLKPDNALVSDFTAAKLADFGTSRAKGEEDVTMTAVGTPLYVAPEIARGENYDESVDVYSFGLTLMEMCVEEPLLDFIGARWVIAFDKKKIPKAAMRIIRPMTEDGWRPVTDENPISFAPPTINSLIVRCCSHDPSQRPSFEEILEELNSKCKIEIDANSYGRHIKEIVVNDQTEEEDVEDELSEQFKEPSSSLHDKVTSQSLPKSGNSIERIIEMGELANSNAQFGSVI